MLLGITRGLVTAVMMVFLTEAHFWEMWYEMFLGSYLIPTLFISLLACFLFNFSVRNSFFSIYRTVMNDKQV